MLAQEPECHTFRDHRMTEYFMWHQRWFIFRLSTLGSDYHVEVETRNIHHQYSVDDIPSIMDDIQNICHQIYFYSEFLFLTDQLHCSNYRNDKKYRSDENCMHAQRKRSLFCTKFVGKNFRDGFNTSSRANSTSTFCCDDLVAWYLQNYRL